MQQLALVPDDSRDSEYSSAASRQCSQFSWDLCAPFCDYGVSSATPKPSSTYPEPSSSGIQSLSMSDTPVYSRPVVPAVSSSSAVPVSSPEPSFVPRNPDIIVDRDSQDQVQTTAEPLDLNNVGSGAVSYNYT